MATHDMQLISIDNGLERWRCPKCKYEFEMTWPPEYRKTILREGNNTAVHRAGQSVPGLSINGAISIMNTDPRLEPFERWLNEHN